MMRASTESSELLGWELAWQQVASASAATEGLVDSDTVDDDHLDRFEGTAPDLPTLIASLNTQTRFALLAPAVQRNEFFFIGSVELVELQ